MKRARLTRELARKLRGGVRLPRDAWVGIPDLAAGPKRKLSKEHRRFLDDMERSVRSIVHPVDNATVFHLQVQYVLDRDGFYVVREVPLSEQRRIDLVVIRNGVTAAVELDRFNPLRRSYTKMLDVPNNVLRVVILRRRIAPLRLSWAERCISMRATLKCVSWLSDGSLTDMATIDAQHRRRAEHIPLREDMLVPHRVGTMHGGRR